MLSRRALLGGMLAVAGASVAGCRPAPRGRVILVHGLGSQAATYRRRKPAVDLLARRLAAQGWAVDVMPYRTEGLGAAHAAALQDLFDQDPTGATVLDMWLEDYERHLTGLSRVDGPTILLGISWGGLLILQAAGRARVRPDGYIAHIPATDPRLIEEFGSYDLSALATLNEPALTMPGLLSWSTDDDRVGYEATEELGARLRCDTIEYVGLGHNTSDEVVANLTGWAGRLLDHRGPGSR